MRPAPLALSARRLAAFGGAGLIVALCAASCGARTGLEPDKDPLELLDASLDTTDGPDAFASGGSCPVSSINEENAAIAEAGVACMAGEQLLLCDVASSGVHGFANYCVTSSSSCSEVDDPSCEPQCNPGEFGLLCSELTTPAIAGCQILFPAPAVGSSGFAFCCPCL
jgi:hypothetical protein